jgi:hypothetical protein
VVGNTLEAAALCLLVTAKFVTFSLLNNTYFSFTLSYCENVSLKPFIFGTPLPFKLP